MHILKGLTLIEVLIGMSIMALISLFMFMFYPVVFENTNIASQVIKYTEVSKQQVETLKDMDFTNLYANLSYLNGTTPVPRIFLNVANSSAGVYYAKRLQNATGVNITDVLDVYAEVSFKVGNRTVGEDQNLNCILDTEEDQNADLLINSSASIRTLIFNPD